MTHNGFIDRCDDVIPTPGSVDRVRLVRDLQDVLGRPEPPLRLLASPPPSVRATRLPAGHRWRRGRFSPFLLIAAALVLISGVAFAAEAITNLGTPTGDTSPSPIFPLSGFHRIGTSLHAVARPELLFISAANDDPSAAERWALVKALDQFGTLANVSTATAPPREVFSYPYTMYYGGRMPTFDLSHATYRSRYLTFVHKDVLDAKDAPYQRLDATEQQLYARYSRSTRPAGAHDPGHFRGTMLNADQDSRHKFPLITVGGYLQTDSNVLYYLDFLLSQPGSGSEAQAAFATFDEVQQSLNMGKPAAGIQPALIPHVNAETNVITALICHADRLQPRSVCSRGVIKQLLRYTK